MARIFSLLPGIGLLASLLVGSGIVVADVAPADFRQKQSDAAWEANIRQQHFQDREIIEGAGQDVLALKVPQIAEDATVVPVSIHSKIPQSEQRYIKRLSIFVDKNPVPLVGNFDLTPNSGKADLAMRIRVDTFSYVRAVAETSDGKLYMAKGFIKAKGACSAPPPASIDDSRKFLGQMKMKTVGDVVVGEPNLFQLMIYHPNITGMAPIRIGSRTRPPPFFVRNLEVDFNGEPVMQAELTFSVSMDPSFRFFFVPKGTGVLTIKGADTKNNQFEASHTVTVL